MTNWKAIIRDVAIICGLTGLAGFVIAFVPGEEFPTLALSMANFLFGTVGFIISGCLTKINRFRHMVKVAIGVWLISLVNIPLAGTTLGRWFLSIIFILVMMVIGGRISFLFVKVPPKMGKN